MPEKKTKVQLPDGTFDGHEVPVTESTERWTDVVLEDGTHLRLKPNVLGAARVDNQYDPEGNPMYAVRSNMMMVIVSVPAHLRRGAPGSKVAN